jgi:ADP-heptose:LPS heptosyltransferase
MRFLRKLWIILRCYAYAVVRGTAKKVSGKLVAGKSFAPHTIIVMPASRLGDMICATPIFHAIKVRYPHCRVVVAGLQNCEKVHGHNPDVDEYLTMNENDFEGNCAQIRQIKADTAIVTTPGFEAMAAFFLSGIPCIIGPLVVNGFCPYQTKSYRLILPLITSVVHRMKYYAPREYVKMLEPLGIATDDTTKHAAFSDEAKHKILDYLKSHSMTPGSDFIVGISVSAGNVIKEWQTAKFAAVADAAAAEFGAQIIFIGSAADVAKTGAVVKLLNRQTRYIDTAGKFSLDELKALISFMDLFISVDTGPIYLAEALNIPTVDITGPIDQNEQPPIGELHKVVYSADRKSPELYVMNARVYNEREARRQTENITPDMVMKAVRELVTDINARRALLKSPL